MDKRIGAQLYTLRDFIQNEEDFEKSAKKVSDMGYKMVQISGVGPIAPEKLKEICDKYNLMISCTHRGYDEYVNNIDGTIDFHKKLGCDIAGLGSMPDEFRNTQKVPEFVEKMNAVAEKMAKEGITFAYHNHHFEFERMENGQYIMDYLIEHGSFAFILDVYWLAFAGVNPAKYIRKMGERAIAIHFKDLAVVEKNIVMAEIGEGNLDWDEIIEASEVSRYALVEQDFCRRDPFESLKMSYDYLTKKGFI